MHHYNVITGKHHFNAPIASSFIGNFKNSAQSIYVNAMKTKLRLNFTFIAVESSSANESKLKLLYFQ